MRFPAFSNLVAIFCLGSLFLWALAAGAHANARSQSRFVVNDAGQVTITLDLREDDVLDLFDIDLSSPQEEPRLTARLEALLPELIKIRGDGARCPLRSQGWKRRGVRAVVITMAALCRPALSTLDVQWGLSSRTSLRLVSFAQIVAPGGATERAVFDRKKNRGRFHVARPKLSEVIARHLPGGAWATLALWLTCSALLLLCGRERRLLLGASFGCGLLSAGFAQLLGPQLLQPEALGPALVGGAALAVAWAPLALRTRPLALRSLQPVLALTLGIAAGALILQTSSAGDDAPAQVILARSLGAVLVFLLHGIILFNLRKLFDMNVDRRQAMAAALGGVAALASIFYLLGS